MNEQTQAVLLAAITHGLLTSLQSPPPNSSPASHARRWRMTAHDCREIANRAILLDTRADPVASERKRHLAELAVRLAINLEWATAACEEHATPLNNPDPDTRQAWNTAHEVLLHTAIGVSRALTATYGYQHPAEAPEP